MEHQNIFKLKTSHACTADTTTDGYYSLQFLLV